MIRNCGYDLAGDILKYLLPNIVGSTVTELNPRDQDWESVEKGVLKSFNQLEFVDAWNWQYSGIHKWGYVFFPLQCLEEDAKCKVHVYLHGGAAAYEFAGMDYIKHAGFNDWAVTNDLIILYPQTKSNFFLNDNGGWGFGDKETKFGKENI